MPVEATLFSCGLPTGLSCGSPLSLYPLTKARRSPLNMKRMLTKYLLSQVSGLLVPTYQVWQAMSRAAQEGNGL